MGYRRWVRCSDCVRQSIDSLEAGAWSMHRCIQRRLEGAA